jgi:bacteriorhodopsin
MVALTTTQHAVFWVGSGGMALGAIAIGVLSRRAPSGTKFHFVTSFAVCAIATAAYYGMANGMGVVRVGTRLVFYARYVDWVLTTPLLLLGLLMVALPALGGDGEAGRERGALVGGVLGADIFMIITGLAASLTSDKSVKYGWYAISCLAFLAVLVVLWGQVRAAANEQGGDVASLFLRLAVVLTTLWFIYPVLWVRDYRSVGQGGFRAAPVHGHSRPDAQGNGIGSAPADPQHRPLLIGQGRCQARSKPEPTWTTRARRHQEAALRRWPGHHPEGPDGERSYLP